MKRSIGDISVDDGLFPLEETRSMNNRLVIRAYQKEGLKTSVSNGFARIEQKVTVKGLTVLMNAKLNDGTFILKGSTAYIKEESLHTAPWARNILESDTIQGPFMIVDLANIEYIVPPAPEAA